ncbi:MAG TPA: adenylyltransferase/cytidyltransferase family protein [archaeon]|nr:adenylyltransferase/cytidyltransferase family protein [archaeon]
MAKDKTRKNAKASSTALLGGKFNKIHPGHLWLLKHARKHGKVIAVLANDKNNDRPYALPALLRKAQLEKTGLADKVVIGEENDFFAVVKKYKPDIILLGYDQRLPPHVEEKLKKYSKKITIIKAKRHGSYRSGNT